MEVKYWLQKGAIKTGRFEKCEDYAPATGELCVIGQLVLRGTRIVLPNKLKSQVTSLTVGDSVAHAQL